MVDISLIPATPISSVRGIGVADMASTSTACRHSSRACAADSGTSAGHSLRGITPEGLRVAEAEFLILITGLDETFEMIRDQFHAFAEEKVTPFAHEWHLKDELIPIELVEELGALGVFGLIEMLVFLGILIVGFIWIWKKGALEWE